MTAKRKYFAPAMEYNELEPISCIAMSVPGEPSLDNGGEGDSDDDPDAKEREDIWGNIW